jgi:hypothetical protein
MDQNSNLGGMKMLSKGWRRRERERGKFQRKFYRKRKLQLGGQSFSGFLAGGNWQQDFYSDSCTELQRLLQGVQ